LSKLWPGWRNLLIISVRTQLSLDKYAPEGRRVRPPAAGKVIALPHLGGLRQEYVSLAA